MEEFFEEDILWPHNESQEENSTEVDPHPAITLSKHTISTPILIPSKVTVSQSWTAGFNYNGTGLNMQDDDGDDDGDDYNGMRIVPPHLLIHRRNTDKMAFSVCVGNARTLKGRDLTVIRDLILRLTGFLEK
ncbi:hypothetical protein LUZ63_019419 [Rhynchospora breviuscula]|uniref:Senescence regulator S40 n=1 Tax=Rhynchospora breviuscula TaxID=2022672 RepID=A0A9Q0C687_9POAL|nr:hypothetical protein LUZ63_019419 [Rhynchospora breviuscula]